MANLNIEIPTFADKYYKNVQMQFANDRKVFGVGGEPKSMGEVFVTLAVNYMQVLKDFAINGNKALTQNLATDKETQDALTQVASLYGIAPYTTYAQAYTGFTTDDYRTLIRAKQAQGQFNGTTQSLLDIAHSLFGELPIMVVDGGNMSVSILVDATQLSAVSRSLLANGEILPKVAGVSYTISSVTTVPTKWNLDADSGETYDTDGRIDEEPTGSWGQTVWKSNKQGD